VCAGHRLWPTCRAPVAGELPLRVPTAARAAGDLIRVQAAEVVHHGPVRDLTQDPDREADRVEAGDSPVPAQAPAKALCEGATDDSPVPAQLLA
jgi:hypothetical protein